MPQVSVLIPVYNAASTVRGTIQSVLDQDFSDFELLLCDDGSSDDSTEIISQFKDSRIRMLRNDRNLGVSATRNHLIREAKGKWIALLDADDEFFPQKLSRCMQEIQSTGCESVSHAMRYITSGGRLRGHISARVVFPSGFMTLAGLAIEVGGFREDLVIGEDSDFFCKIRAKCKVHYINEPLTAYRLRSDSHTDKNWFDKRIIEHWYRQNPDTFLPSDTGAHREWFGKKPVGERIRLTLKWYGQRCGRRAAAYFFMNKYVPAFWYAGLSLGFNPTYLTSRLNLVPRSQK